MMMTGIQTNQVEYLKPKIMIVEDEAVSASLLKHTVERYEYIVCCVANSGEEALEMVEMYQPDLILMDIVLAGEIDGIDAAKQIRSKFNIPIVFTTGYDDQARLDRAKLLTPVSYILKPYNDRQIRVAIEMALYVGKVERERRQAENSLRESEERFDLAIRSALMGVWTWDITNDRRYFDDRVCHLLGITPTTFTGTQEEFFRRVHPDDHNAIEAAMARTLAQDVMYRPEYRVVWPDGSVHNITSRGRLTRDDAGKPIRVNGILWDVTAQKKAEEEHKKLETQLRQAQKMEAIGTLAGGIAHDFNNILGSIIGYAELALIDAPPESDLKDCLDQIYKGGKRAADLVKHILAFSRQSEQLKKPLRIGPIVKECLKLLRASLPSTIEIVQNISKEDRNTLADPTQIHQIIMNLGTNAMQAMREKGGCLTVKLEHLELTSKEAIADWELEIGPYLRLTVRDTGKGIDPEIIDRIFEPYFTTKDIGEGTGLGLSVIYGIVQSHNGAVTVSSEPGNGTEFNIYLPQTRNNIDADEDVTIEYVTGTGKILLVDDEEALVNSGQLVLERLGYEVRPYTSSLAALEAFRNRPDDFDLVITDYTMPQMTGIELAKEILAVRPDLPIIICTGYSANLTPKIVRQTGVRALIMKPIMHDEISKLVLELLKDKEKNGG
ncbi:MAG: response regulator [Deltaproteobacteria bacterium]|nr:response regulator [Deltaproteobacteria bacterium]